MLALQTYDIASYDELEWSDDCTCDGYGVSRNGVKYAEIVEDGDATLNPRDLCPVNHDISPAATHCSDSACKIIPPPNYICPLTLSLMAEPVIDTCGHCFDRDAIATWLEYHSICPISRKPLSTSDLIPARTLHERIQHWHKLHGSFDSLHDFSLRSESGTLSQLELMLLPQERNVIALIKLRRRVLARERSLMQVMWCVAAVTTLSLLLAVLYSFHIALRGSL